MGGQAIIAGCGRCVHREEPYDPWMPETAPKQSHNARAVVTTRVMQRARKFPLLFPSPLGVDGIEDRDLALAHAIDQAVARRWLTLVTVLQAKLDRPWARVEAPVQATLLVGAAQLLLMERVPDHAVINEAVDWIKPRRAKAAAMVNAVLRRVAELRGEKKSPEKKRPGKKRPGLFSASENRPGLFFPGLFFSPRNSATRRRTALTIAAALARRGLIQSTASLITA